MDTLEELENTIKTTLQGAQVYVTDPRSDGKHLEAIVISKEFEDISLVKQHQLVMNALKEKFRTTLHALQLKTYTPKKWEESQCKL